MATRALPQHGYRGDDAPSTSPPAWLTTSEAAAVMRCSESLIRRLVREGTLPHRRLSPRAIRIPAWACGVDVLTSDSEG